MALVYSCCFWFSLRLGGIIIGLFSIFQGIALLIGCCLVYTHSDMVKAEFSEWNNQYNLIYSKDVLENILEDPQKHISWTIACTCVYLISCAFYIYGAYVYNNILLLPYIILELLRLIFITATVATGLLLLKQNTMDIGSLIGASVVGGFFLLGMFYLWVCAANLPILINEMKVDEQAATIAKLQQLLETNQKSRRGYDNVRYALPEGPPIARDLFVVSNKTKALDLDRLVAQAQRSRIPVPY